ncbi:hypothetical protein Hypma_013734 [Hypsizygus marmoreus]|uniref:Uncharacterized protein n=1 Tax=Hypsizygus marmoreus TaxID=39966 RepID=A0A369JFR1_HYPMA|nr:hypothetical protein Hypma_013734 [Hypsizygus marmoreus]
MLPPAPTSHEITSLLFASPAARFEDELPLRRSEAADRSMDTSFLAEDPSDSDSDTDSFSSLPPLVSYQDSSSSSNSSSESVPILTLIDDRGTAVADYRGPAVVDDDGPPNGVLHPGTYAGDITPLDILPPAIRPQGEAVYLFFEQVTQDRDRWGYQDAQSFTLCHSMLGTGLEQLPLVSLPEDAPEPRGHPYWCAKHELPIVRQEFSREFDGVYDNHPLREFSNSLCPIPLNRFDPSFELAVPFIYACETLASAVVKPADWHGIPDTVQRRAVRHEVWEAGYRREQNPDLIPSYTPYSTIPPAGVNPSLRIEEDDPSKWQDQPLGGTVDDWYFREHYSSPYEHHEDSIAFNLWNPQIVELRRFRHEFEDGLRFTLQYLLSPAVRLFINMLDSESDLVHFFFHHCPFFRLLDPHTPLTHQGFSCRCLHFEYAAPSQARYQRKPHPPRNPVITAEEDEFLYHAANLFEMRGSFEVANSMRRIRETIPFLPDHAFNLFDAGYLSSIHHFDGRGMHYPLLRFNPKPRL